MGKGVGTTRSSSSNPKGLAVESITVSGSKLAMRQSNGETWYEGDTPNGRVRIMQETPGDNNWWNAEVDMEFIRNADGRAMSFQSAKEAADEVSHHVKSEAKIIFGSAPANYSSKTISKGNTEFRISAVPTGFGNQQKNNGRFTVRYGEGSGDYRDFSWGSSYSGNTTKAQAWNEVKNWIKNYKK